MPSSCAVLVHGDDVITSGGVDDVAWFHSVLQAMFEISITVFVKGKGESQEANLLNRVISVYSHGCNYEAGHRHGEYIIKALNLNNAKGVSSPGAYEKPWKQASDA